MTSSVWPIVCSAILITAHLHAAEPRYASPGYENRQFNVNPGNMMNPMRNIFGYPGNPGGYNDYRYAYPAHPGYPPVYGHPGVPYGQPPIHYNYGGVAPTTAYPSAPYGYRPQTPAAAPAQTDSAPTGYGDNRSSTPGPLTTTPGHQFSPQERYRFRPLDNTQPTPDASPVVEATPRADPVMQQAQPLKFRPLDKPGYSR
ncbi:MAG: hypothetical protein KZQ76_12680 [Candidatus Thiodiazotropha sp. (ex Epidulcina cf. delphinae)]|nr:hypothetical protein [Candidatus Thiodiazotropha sp. (ex Epidulcina cf. delphinae)]